MTRIVLKVADNSIKVKSTSKNLQIRHSSSHHIDINHIGRTGPAGAPGPAGQDGAPGPAGIGIPAGGTTGQVLIKDSATDYDTSFATLTKSDVGLSNVDNTSDADKPISTATQTALDTKVGLGGDIGGTASVPLVKSRSVTKTVATTGREADYVCDGTADDVQINSAITAVNAAGGGTVHIANGTYNISSTILLKNNVTLQGEGNGTALFLINSANCRTISNSDPTGGSGGNSNLKIRNIKVDGNGTNQTASTYDNIYFAFTTNITVENCYVLNGNRHNILLSDSSQYIRIISNRLQDAKGLSNCSTSNVNDMVFANNVSTGAAQTGIKTDVSHTVTITGNTCVNNTTHQIFVTNGTNQTITGNAVRGGQNGVRITSNDYTTVTGNSIRSCSQDGIVLLQNCNYTSITGNIIRDIGTATTNTYDGIDISDVGTGCTNTTIVGNAIVGSGSNMRYGVHSSNSSDKVYLGINDISGYVTATTSLVGSNNSSVYQSGGTDVAVADGGTGASTASAGLNNLLPTQTGNNGKVLQTDGSSATWQTVSGGSGITRSIVSSSGSFTAGSAANTDYVYLITGLHTTTMPTAVGNTDRYTIKNNHSAAVTVGTTSSQTIDGTLTIEIAPEDSVDLISNNANWFVV